MAQPDYSQPPAMPTGAPPRKPVPTALWVTLGIVGVGGCAIVIAYAFFIQTLVRQMQSTSRATSGVEHVPFVGPDPWQPVRGAGAGWHRYKMLLAGIEIDFPTTVSKRTQHYERSDLERMSGYFYYDGETIDGVGGIYGLQVRAPEEATVASAVYSLEGIFKEDPSFKDFRHQWRVMELGSMTVQRLSGSFQWYGDTWCVEGTAFVNKGFLIGVYVEDPNGAKAKSQIDRILKSLKVETGQ